MTVFLFVLAGIVGLVFYACIGICVFVVCDEVFEWEDEEGSFLVGLFWPIGAPLTIVLGVLLLAIGFIHGSIYQRISPYERGQRRDRQRVQALGKIDIKKDAHPLADK